MGLALKGIAFSTDAKVKQHHMLVEFILEKEPLSQESAILKEKEINNKKQHKKWVEELKNDDLKKVLKSELDRIPLNQAKQIEELNKEIEKGSKRIKHLSEEIRKIDK